MSGPPSLVPSWRQRSLDEAVEFFPWPLGLNGAARMICYQNSLLWYLARQVVWHINEARRAVYRIKRPRNSLLYTVESVAAARAILDMLLDLRVATPQECDEAHFVLDELIVDAHDYSPVTGRDT